MKKLVFFAISLLAAGSVSAQYLDPYYLGGRPHKVYSNRNEVKRNVDDFYTPRIGLEAGASISNTVNAYNSKFSTAAITGLQGGITFDLPLFYPLSLAPEALYSQKGYAAITTDGNFTQRTQYIDVPVLLKFKVGPIFNIYVGPQVSYLISTQNTWDNGSQVTNEHYYTNPGFSHVFSGVGGVSFDLGHYVELHARYVLDFQPIKPDGDVTYLESYKNQVWQIGLGFKL